MPINVEWRNERGQTLARYDGPAVTRQLIDRAPAASMCLRFIDPYGDTVFNQRQIPVLLDELRSLAAGTRDGQAETLRLLSQFLEQTLAQVHTYAHFLGD